MNKCKFKVGDQVSLEKWDATVPTEQRLGVCQITAIREDAFSVSGWSADITNTEGLAMKNMGTGWLTPID